MSASDRTKAERAVDSAAAEVRRLQSQSPEENGPAIRKAQTRLEQAWKNLRRLREEGA